MKISREDLQNLQDYEGWYHVCSDLAVFPTTRSLVKCSSKLLTYTCIPSDFSLHLLDLIRLVHRKRPEAKHKKSVAGVLQIERNYVTTV
jgi:hypothetical protein